MSLSCHHDSVHKLHVAVWSGLGLTLSVCMTPAQSSRYWNWRGNHPTFSRWLSRLGAL